MQANELKHQAKLKEWEQEILECRSSGMTVDEWCSSRGYHRTTYYRWEKEIFQKGELVPVHSKPKTPVLVELPTAPAVVQPVRESQTVAVMRCGMLEVELSNAVSPELLGMLKEMICHAQ